VAFRGEVDDGIDPLGQRVAHGLAVGDVAADEAVAGVRRHPSRLARLPAYVRLSKLTTRTFGSDSSRWWIKLLPMKPQPPVTRTGS